MIENNSDPFEDAAASARSEIHDDAPLASVEGDFADDTQESIRPRGRPRGSHNRSGRKLSHKRANITARQRRRAQGQTETGGTPAGEAVYEAQEDKATRLEVKVKLAPIPSASVALAIKQLDALLVRRAGTLPLSEEEASQGGVVFAPILDHYMPLLAGDGGMWVPAAIWVLGAYAPRVIELSERKRLGAGDAPPGATFRATGATQSESATGTVSAAPVAKTVNKDGTVGGY